MSSPSREESVAELPASDPRIPFTPPPVPPPAEREGGTILDTGSVQVGGWVTASPPRVIEVVQHVFRFPWLLWRHRDLITTSVGRELRSRFSGTVLGWAWPLLTPLLFFGIYYFIFTKLLAFKFEELPPEQEAAMGVYMFVGVLVWSSFGDSISRCSSSIVENGNLIKKVAFPSEILPLDVVLVNIVTMLFGMVMFIVGTLVTPLFGLTIWETPSVLALGWAFVLLPLQVLFTYGLGIVLATTQVYLRDTVHVVVLAVTVWMFATPVFWAPQIVGDGELGGFLWILDANPLYHLVYAWRCVLMSRLPVSVTVGGEERPFYATPIEDSVAVFAIWAVAVFVVGYTFFLLARRRFADEV